MKEVCVIVIILLCAILWGVCAGISLATITKLQEIDVDIDENTGFVLSVFIAPISAPAFFVCFCILEYLENLEKEK